MIINYLTELFMTIYEKASIDMNNIIKEMAKSEAQSKIKIREEKHQRQYAMRAFNAHKKTANKQKINYIRTRQK